VHTETNTRSRPVCSHPPCAARCSCRPAHRHKQTHTHPPTHSHTHTACVRPPTLHCTLQLKACSQTQTDTHTHTHGLCAATHLALHVVVVGLLTDTNRHTHTHGLCAATHLALHVVVVGLLTVRCKNGLHADRAVGWDVCAGGGELNDRLAAREGHLF